MEVFAKGHSDALAAVSELRVWSRMTIMLRCGAIETRGNVVSCEDLNSSWFDGSQGVSHFKSERAAKAEYS